MSKAETDLSGRAPSVDLRRTAISGTAFIAVSQICKITLQFATLLVVSRLLKPDDFGVVAMVMPIVGILPLLQDFGLQQALIQAHSVSEAQVNRIFWVNVAIAITTGAVLVAAAPFVARFYGEPRVEPLLALWATPVMLTSIGIHHVGLLNRHLRFRAIAMIEIAVSFGTSIAAIAGAFLFANYWAMLASTTAGAVLMVLLAWNATRWVPGSPVLSAQIGHLIRFGAELTGSDVLRYLSRNVGNVIIATVFGATKLGLFDLSYKLVLLPISHVNGPIGRVLQPLLGRIRNEPERYQRGYLLVASATIWTIAPAVGALAFTTPEFIDVVLGDQWHGAGPALFWLSVAGLCNPLVHTTIWLFVTQHRTRDLLRWSLLSAAMTILSFVVGLPWGLPGVSAGYALNIVLLQTPILFAFVGRRGPVSARDLWSIQAPVFVAAALTFGLSIAGKAHLDMPAIVWIASVALTSYVVLGAVLLCTTTGRERLRTLAAIGAASFSNLARSWQ